MSAFLVSKKHIDFLVSAAYLWGRTNLRQYLPRELAEKDLTASDVGRLLWRENLLSVAHRYDGVAGFEETPGAIEKSIATYRHAIDLNAPSQALKVIKAIQCLEYQSCEHDGWEPSAAHHFCRALLSEAIRNLPGYDAAPWGID